MKNVLAVLAMIMITVVVLTGCSGTSEPEKSDGASVDSLKTIGDVIELEAEGKQSAVYNGKAVYAFQLGDTYYRVIAVITPEQEQEYMNIDIMEEGYEDKQNEMLAPVEISEIEDLSEQILSQEDRDALVGKTGEELQNEGWTYSGHDLENMEFWMNYGPFAYTVVFDGEVAEEDYESFDAESGIKDMKVKSVGFNGLGDDATTIE